MSSLWSLLLVPVPPSSKQTLFSNFQCVFNHEVMLGFGFCRCCWPKIELLVLTHLLKHHLAGKIVLEFPCLSLSTVCTCSIVVFMLKWFFSYVFVSQSFFGNNRLKSPMSPLNQVKQAVCKPLSNLIVFWMKTYVWVWHLGKVFSMQLEWTYSCACLICNNPNLQTCAEKFWNCGFEVLFMKTSWIMIIFFYEYCWKHSNSRTKNFKFVNFGPSAWSVSPQVFFFTDENG